MSARAPWFCPSIARSRAHGDTDQDSHLELPLVRKSLDQLRKLEWPSFAHACRDGIEALMTAHVRFTALDRELPATLSAAVVTGLLRHQIGYDGVVFSDDMEMNAISANFSPGEAAVLALRAGVDVLLFCHALQAVGVDTDTDIKGKGAAVPGQVAERRRVTPVQPLQHLSR